MVTGPDSEGFHTVDVMGSVDSIPITDSTWEAFDESAAETGEVTVEALTPEEAREEHYELTHALRDAVQASDLPAIREVSFAISVLEHQFPELEPDTFRRTERDN